jgi:Arc/MetJ-type ribon-helix-helix transcriptional regulator
VSVPRINRTSIGSILGSMKSKTSITLSTTLLEQLDRIVGENGSRSDLIEKAVEEYIERLARAERDRRDLEILNRSAKRMRGDAKDVLRYQAKL